MKRKWTSRISKKAGIGGAGLALGLSGASAFFAPKLGSQEKISYGNEKIAFYGKHQAGISTPMQKNIYFVVLDLHTTDKDKIISCSRIGRIIVPS